MKVIMEDVMFKIKDKRSKQKKLKLFLTTAPNSKVRPQISLEHLNSSINRSEPNQNHNNVKKLQEARIQASHNRTPKAATMSDVDDPDVPETSDASLASSRSRRGPSKKTNSRFEALKKLKAAKARDWSYEVRIVIIF